MAKRSSTPLDEAQELAGRLAARGYFDMRVVQQLFDEHQSGRVAWHLQLWNLLMLELWHRMFIDQRPAGAPARTPVADYGIFRVRRDRCASPRTEREHDFWVLETGDWVNVIGLTPDEHILLIEQYRFGSSAVTLEIPGGTIDPGDAPVIVKYQVRIDDRATGDLPIQSTTTATPVGGVNSGPIPFPSGNGVTPNAPTIVVVPPCVSNDDCSPGAPVCDKKNGAPHCTDVCDSDVDCQGTPGGTEVCSTAKKCVQCSAGTSAACRT